LDDNFDFQALEVKSIQFQRKLKVTRSKQYNKWQSSINKLLKSNLKAGAHDIYSTDVCLNEHREEYLFVTIPIIILEEIWRKNHIKGRVSAVIFKALISVVPNFAIDYINVSKFNSRFDSLIAYLDFPNKQE